MPVFSSDSTQTPPIDICGTGWGLAAFFFTYMYMLCFFSCSYFPVKFFFFETLNAAPCTGHLGWGSHVKAQVHSIDAVVWEAKEKWVFLALKRIPKIFRSWCWCWLLAGAGCWLVLAGASWRRCCCRGEVVIVLEPGERGNKLGGRWSSGLGFSWGTRPNYVMEMEGNICQVGLGLWWRWSPKPF